MKSILSLYHGRGDAHKPHALIFDIDDTILDINQSGKKNKVRYIAAPQNKKLFIYPGIKCVVELIQFAYNLGYKIIILTARQLISKPSTVTNLNMLNVPYDELIFREYNEPLYFKYSVREKLMKKYNIIFSAGDQKGDVNGPPGLVGIKFPASNDKTYGVIYNSPE